METTAREQRYYQRLAEVAVAPLWRIPGTTDPEPAVDEVPHVWRWRDLAPLLFEAAEVMDLGEEAERRALNAYNPSRKFGTTHNLVAGYQLVLPGEEAPTHRHTPGAIRFMLSGSGHTIVDGEPVLMEPGDLVLTPSLTWHDHRHVGDEPMIWLDGLDVPFVKAMRAGFYEDYPGRELQALLASEGDSVRRYGAGLAPANDPWAKPYSPLMNYKWTTAYEALRRLAETGADPHEAVRLEYVNPVTGGHVLPTMACYLQLLVAGTATRGLRHTSSTVFCVVRGSGHSVIGGKRFDWETNDFFAVPSWTWYEHVADPAQEVVLFSMSDRPMLEPFALYREQRA
ncbi:cupin domain-containing protein [Dactylosporangium sp. AC04546]|uniref:cupin domain-containing protein n=1 Tax=Dactylosporangium sp. AC04546 TaxID=2862460 RepID=UPI001EDD1C8B|nr:cupin domain-containing protein [Dactylosporangium sp. AC04546]WVK80845.1 cupin domain-containing protein [Dactylosporangium sp. AC04546]